MASIAIDLFAILMFGHLQEAAWVGWYVRMTAGVTPPSVELPHHRICKLTTVQGSTWQSVDRTDSPGLECIPHQVELANLTGLGARIRLGWDEGAGLWYSAERRTD